MTAILCLLAFIAFVLATFNVNPTIHGHAGLNGEPGRVYGLNLVALGLALLTFVYAFGAHLH